MDWTQFLAVFGAIVLGSGGISGIIIHLWKKQIEQKHVIELEIFKSKLQQELEGYKAGYQRFLNENTTRFSWWHNKQAEVLSELYLLFADYKMKVEYELGRISAESIKTQSYCQIYDKFFIFFKRNNIFLEEKARMTLHDFFNEYEVRTIKKEDEFHKGMFCRAEQTYLLDMRKDIEKNMEMIKLLTDNLIRPI